MDQKVMAGVGNIWKHETLFRCAIYPWRLVRDIDDETLRALIARARGLLLLSVGKGDDPRGGRRPVDVHLHAQRAALPSVLCAC